MKYLILFLPVLAFGQGTSAQSIVIGSRSPQGEISFQPVDEFQINQSKKIKFLAEPSGNVDPETIKKLPKVDLGQGGGFIRNDGKGRLVRLNGAGRKRDVVIPEKYELKVPAKAEEVPGRLELTVIRSKKTKQSEVLAPEVFFVFLSGATPDGATLDFVSRDWVFLNQEEQLSAMQGFVASFRMSPAAEEFRASLERKLGAGLAAFEDGGPYKDLLQLRKFAELGIKAFPNDAPLKGLHGRLVSRIDFVEARLKLLRSLAVAADWDALLDQYQEFEHYQWSFPDVMALRQQALEESARVHSRRARGFALREDHDIAAREAATAQLRDPANKEIANLREGERGLAAQAEARRAAGSRKALPKESPQGRQFDRALQTADRAIQDKDFTRAQQELQDALRVNPDAPEILLVQARLALSSNRLSEVVPLLDRYDRLAASTEERVAGDKVRNDVLYELLKRREATKKDIETLSKSGDYSTLNDRLMAALQSDPEDSLALFYAGQTAAALKDGPRASKLLADYLERSNSLEGDLKMRDKAWHLRTALSAAPAAPPAQGTPDWMSGRKLAEGVYYSPESLAFQIPFDAVTGNKVRQIFTWDKGKLQTIVTNFDDEKAVRAWRLLGSPGASESEISVSPAAAGEGAFYFEYLPGGALLGMRQKAPKANANAAVRVRLSRTDKQPPHLVDDAGQPLLALPSSPYVDVAMLGLVEGAPVGTTVAGNSFFNPFLWDGMHYFTVQYDRLGRAESAQEWGADNLLKFKWDGERLTGIFGYRKGSDTPYYQRTIAYAGSQIMGEDYTLNARAGHIRYIYMGKTLQQVKVEHEGKEWIVKPRS